MSAAKERTVIIPHVSSRREQSGAVPALKAFLVQMSSVLALFAAAVVIRFYRLGDWSFWPDEVFSFGNKSDGFNDSLLRRSLATDLIQAAVRIWGTSEWTARLIPALIGCASIPLLYFLLRRCMPRPGALMAAALLTTSLWHVYWSQNARFYSLLFLFFNLGLLLFYLGLEEGRPWYMLAALVLFGLAARERMAALLGIPAVIVYLGVLATGRFGRPRGFHWRNMAIFLGPALVAGAFFVVPFVANWEGWLRGFGYVNNSPFFLAAGTLYYVGIPLVVFALASAFWHLVLRSRFALLLALTAVLPVMLIMAIALFQYSANRYIFFSLFSWLALGGLGIQALVERLPRDSHFLALAAAAALLAASASDLFLYYTVQNGNRADWRSAFTYIAEHGQPGDYVVTSDFDIFAYYLGSPFVYKPWGVELPEATRVWYVEDLVADQVHPQLVELAAEQAPLAAEYDVHLPWRTFPMRVYLSEVQ